MMSHPFPHLDLEIGFSKRDLPSELQTHTYNIYLVASHASQLNVSESELIFLSLKPTTFPLVFSVSTYPIPPIIHDRNVANTLDSCLEASVNDAL